MALTVSQIFLVFNDPDSLEEFCSSYFVECSSVGICQMFVRKSKEVKSHFHYIVSRVRITADVDCEHPAESVVGVLHCKVALFPPFCIVLWKSLCATHT